MKFSSPNISVLILFSTVYPFSFDVTVLGTIKKKPLGAYIIVTPFLTNEQELTVGITEIYS